MSRTRYLLAGAAIFCGSATAAQAMAQVRQFDVAPQPASTGIPLFARQAGIQILVSGTIADGVSVNRVKGVMDIAAALRALLAGTDLVPVMSGTKVVLRQRGALDRKIASVPAGVQSAPIAQSGTEPVQIPAAEDSADEEQDIVVTGIRNSLERAADVKRTSVQVVDSIVATDIGKLPDPTVASALQRVPGIQVQNDRNNELSSVRIRGLTDILTMVNGREVFTSTGRGFDLQDVPAEALARIDAFKSQAADQIEGGVAGAIDLKLNRPFSFRDTTVVLSARNNYGVAVDSSNPQFGALATTRFDTGIGEIGVLANATYSHADTIRSASNMTDRRSSGSAPLNSPGYLIPQVIQNMPDVGAVTRWQANGAIQWQASPSLQAYAEGLYTYFRTTTGFAGFNPQPFTNGTTMTDVVASDDCFQTRVNAGGTNPTIVNNADGTRSLQPFTVQTLCDIKSARFNNIVVNQNSSSNQVTQRNKMIAGGLNYDQGPARVTLDVAYQTSSAFTENVNAEVGQRVSTLLLETDVDNGPRITLDPAIPPSSANLSLRNSFNQNFTYVDGSLFQTKLDGSYEIGGLLQQLQLGLRFAKREAHQQSVLQTVPVAAIGFGNIGTPSEATARLVSSLPLSSNFLGVIAFAPRINNGSAFLGANPAYLRSEEGRNELRALFKVALRQPDYDPTKEFNADETTYAGYAQANYEIPVGAMTLNGVIGTRVTKTDRTISGFTRSGGVIEPVSATTSDVDLLPNATARLQFPGGFQSRLSWSRTIRRPDFVSLNPAETLTLVGNVFLLNTGSRGNPELRPQKSDSFDATAEYYFRGGYVAVTGFYRSIKDRVVNSATQETIDGLNYLISSPRNVGSVKLKGVETSAQYFFDFLPGALSGLGVQGAFTLVDSEITGSDPLAGYPLLGVSKYNYTAGLLYDKAGLSGRLVYTYRSRYYIEDNSGGVQLRPIDSARVNEVYTPVLLSYARPAGRLDFSVGYDVSKSFRIDVGGTNILRSRTSQYRGQEYLNYVLYGDEATYTIGARVRF
ncbi:TonB-dependent receptor [Sphingomonas sp. DG1-23]|uniref:TonB-dependent receptor n=1 Tax=Sphingomonas sp. DG1-23 TaxID=3068316 RepID=UPI00273E868F|nr:TonB-dependent receptor [Sphingomonas sp. DG1-23]MDP5278734.1 TonB-dependent receptor [Sphingomonas sp. DG1-23]